MEINRIATADTVFFWEGCGNHQLRFQKCDECGHVRWPASIICPKCHSIKTSYIVSEGEGEIYSFVIYHAVFNSNFKNKVPYVVAVVRLKEGPHLLTNIVDCDFAKLRCGRKVKVVWRKIGEVTVPCFQ